MNDYNYSVMKGNLDIILVSKRHNLCYSFKISLNTLFLIFTLLFLLSFGAISFLIQNTHFTIAKVKITLAEQENRRLLSKLQNLKERLIELANEIRKEIAQDNRERSFLQIAQIAPDIWAMGVGGRKRSRIPDGLTEPAARILDELYQSVDIIQGQLNLRCGSLAEIKDEINKKFDLWGHIPSINPVPGTGIGSGFGYRVDPIDGTIRMHEGVDLGAPTGTPILASADGIVSYADWNMGYGYVVDIDHGYGFVSRYAHCSKILVRVGDFVKRGQVIALVGRTGRTTCPHLHYEVHVSGIKVNPANYIHSSEIVFD